jgi:thiol-disulfide isomerase/thioredoxin
MSKLVNIEEFKLSDKYNIIVCTAAWCGPCKNIKPHVLSILSSKEKVSETTMEQEKYQAIYNKYVPYFIILDKTLNLWVEKIQSSDAEQFRSFIGKYIPMPILDENF